MSFKKVCELLPSLSPAEIEQIKERCIALTGSGIVRKRTNKVSVNLERCCDDDWYCPAVGRYAVAKGWWPPADIHIALSQKGLALLPGYRQQSKAMRDHIEGQLIGVQPHQLAKLGDVCVQAVALSIEKTNKWLTYKQQPLLHTDIFALLSRVDCVPMALEDQLPGYLANGMLGLVINSRGGSNVKSHTRVQGRATRS